MPTLMRVNGARVVIYPNDHDPAHVHIIGPGVVARFALNCPDGRIETMNAEGLKRPALERIGEAAEAALDVLCAEWSRLHG